MENFLAQILENEMPYPQMSVVLPPGSMCGILYSIKFLERHPRMVRSKWSDSVVYRIVSTFGWFCRQLPHAWAMQLGSGIGKWVYHLLKNADGLPSTT